MRKPPVASVLVLAMTGLLATTGRAMAVGVMISGTGERIVHVADVDPAHASQLALGDVAVGFKYAYASLMFLDFWHYGGELVLYRGDAYWPLTDELAAAAGVDRARLRSPWSYYTPDGLLIVGGLVVVGLLVQRRYRKHVLPRVRTLLRDPRYRHAKAQVDPADARKWTFEQGVEYLIAEGIEPAEARRNLDVLYNA